MNQGELFKAKDKDIDAAHDAASALAQSTNHALCG
jgi:hypothetical protein